MKKTAGVLTAIVLIALGFLLLGNSSGEDGSTSEPPQPTPEDMVGRQGEIEDREPATDNLYFTQDELDQLSQKQQDEMLEEFVLDFWEKELGLSETDAEQENLSLEIFNRPYLRTLTEREFARLSPEDQKKALDEIFEVCREVHSYVMDVIAEANSCLADKDYANAEACFVHSLEIGRELSVNKEGLVITRLVGIALEKAGLNGLVKLYTETGDNSKVQMAREQLSEIEEEVQEIKRTAKESETRS